MRQISIILNGLSIFGAFSLLSMKGGLGKFFNRLADAELDAWLVMLMIVALGMSLYCLLRDNEDGDSLISLWIEAKKSELRRKID